MSWFIGEIKLVPYPYAPRDWAFCDGSVLPIAQHTALFALIGKTYGGDGSKTFALPDLRGRLILSPGKGDGLSNYVRGEKGGVEGVTIDVTTMAAHTHPLNVSSAAATLTAPFGQFLGVAGSGIGNVYHDQPDVHMHADTITLEGGAGAPHDNRQPYLALNYVIALRGDFPQK